MKPGENPTLLQKIAAGMTTGAIAISIANPPRLTDYLKGNCLNKESTLVLLIWRML